MVPPLGQCVNVLDVAARQLCAAAEVVGPKAVFDEVMLLTSSDVRQDMTDEEKELWELGGQEDEENEVEREDEVKAERLTDGQETGKICKNRLDFTKGGFWPC
jgi:hypothetical protein